MKIKLLLIILGALFLSSCGTLIHEHVTIDDLNLYYLKEASPEEFAVNMHFLSTGTLQISESEWDDMSQGKVCMDLASWANINTAIGKLCSQAPCDYQTLQLVNAFTARAEAVSGLTLH